MTDINNSSTHLGIKYVARTDVGLVRAKNEDNFIVTESITDEKWVVPKEEFEVGPEGSAFIVADGMGGAVAGQLASSIATEAIKRYLSTNIGDAVDDLKIRRHLDNALVYANEQILKYSNDKPEYAGMGTTATICFLKGTKLYISWIGDSRVYRYSTSCRVTTNAYNSGDLEILTDDHSVVWEEVIKGRMSPEEARVAPNSNVITQSLGDPFRTPRPDHRVYDLYEGDYILNCSDGLNGMLSDDRLSLLFDEYCFSSEDLSDKLIEEAKNHGGTDNITTVLMQVLKGPGIAPILSDTLGDKPQAEEKHVELEQEPAVEIDHGNIQDDSQSIKEVEPQDKAIEKEIVTDVREQINIQETTESNKLAWFSVILSFLIAGLLAYSILNFETIKSMFLKGDKDHKEIGETIIKPVRENAEYEYKIDQDLTPTVTEKIAKTETVKEVETKGREKVIEKKPTKVKEVIKGKPLFQKPPPPKITTEEPGFSEYRKVDKVSPKKQAATLDHSLDEKTPSVTGEEDYPKNKETVTKEDAGVSKTENQDIEKSNSSVPENVKETQPEKSENIIEEEQKNPEPAPQIELTTQEEIQEAIDLIGRKLGVARKNRRKVNFINDDEKAFDKHYDKADNYLKQLGKMSEENSSEFESIFKSAIDECRELTFLFSDYNIE